MDDTAKIWVEGGAGLWGGHLPPETASLPFTDGSPEDGRTRPGATDRQLHAREVCRLPPDGDSAPRLDLVNHAVIRLVRRISCVCVSGRRIWSYVRDDDRNSGGAITTLADRVMKEFELGAAELGAVLGDRLQATGLR